MNRYSDKINGYWEAGNHYYIEIRDDLFTLRGNRREILGENMKISYDVDAIERGEKTPLIFENNVFTTNPDGEPMCWFEESYFENGELKLLEAFSYLDRKDAYTAVKVDHGPFAHIIFRDDEFRDKLQGEWVQWGTSFGGPMVIRGDEIFWLNSGGKFHVVSYTYAPDKVFIVSEDLTREDFGGFTRVEVRPDMLITTMIVFDMSMPLSVFAREDMIDKIEVPEGAKRPPVSTMMGQPGGLLEPPVSDRQMGFMGMNMMNMVNMMNTQPPEPEESKPIEPDDNGKYKCPACGQEFEESLPRFCYNCGGVLKGV